MSRPCPRDVPAMSPRCPLGRPRPCGEQMGARSSISAERAQRTRDLCAVAGGNVQNTVWLKLLATRYSSIQSNALQWYCLHFSCSFEKEMLVCRARSAASLVQIHAWSTLLSAKRQGFASSCYISLQSPHIFHTSD